MSTLRKPRCISFEEYLALEHGSEIKHEFVAGYVYAMAGASEAHNRVAGNVFFHLRAAARGGPCGVFMADMKVRVEDLDRCYYPDVSVVCDPADADPYVKRAPCIVVEVLSESTESTDRREKLSAYLALPSLRYCLLVSARTRQVEYYVRREDGEFAMAELEDGERLELQCNDYRAELDLPRVYEDVDMP
jgi:Uma2 family endonuclease